MLQEAEQLTQDTLFYFNLIDLKSQTSSAVTSSGDINFIHNIWKMEVLGGIWLLIQANSATEWYDHETVAKKLQKGRIHFPNVLLLPAGIFLGEIEGL